MKNYDETVSAVFDRINDYNVKKKRRTVLACRITAACCAVTLLGGSVWYLNRPQHDIPVTLDPDKNEVTTTAAPTEGEDTTTTTTVNTTITTIDTTTAGGVVTPPTTAPTIVPAPSKPTATQAPTTGKTEPPKSTSGTKGPVTGYIPPIPTTTQPTTSTGSDRLLITGDDQDNHKYDESTFNKKEKYITPALREKMAKYKNDDVIYAVIVTLPVTNEDQHEDFWNSNAEWAQLYNDYYHYSRAFEKEVFQFYPYWTGNVNTIEIWTDSMKTNYERTKALWEEMMSIKEQYQVPYMRSVVSQRFETLKSLCEKEPIAIVSEIRTYYVELTAEAINTLAEQGGYVFRLASKEKKDYGSWDFDE